MPSSRPDPSRGAQLAERLRRGCRTESRSLTQGARSLPTLHGVTQKCEFIVPQENVLTALGDILVDSGRIFKYGDNFCMTTRSGEQGRLVVLAMDGKIESHAFGLLANLVVCQVGSEQSDVKIQFPPPRRLVGSQRT